MSEVYLCRHGHSPNMTLAEFLLARIAEAEDELSPRDEFNRWAWVECESKQRIVEHHAPDPDAPDAGLCAICWWDGPRAQAYPCETLMLLALPYADHPDYREEWRP